MRGTLRLLRPHVGRQRSVLGVAGFSTLLVTAAELARPFPLKLVIDRLFSENGGPGPFRLESGDLVLLAGIAALVLAIAGVDALAAYQMELRLRRAGEAVSHSLRVAVYSHLQRLSLSFHEGRRQGDLVTRATGDVHAVGTLFSESLGAVVSSALLLVGMLVVSFIIDPVLALAAFSVAPLLAVVTWRTRRRVKAVARRQRTKEGEIASVATEALSAMREVKALGSEEFERERLERISEERRQAGLEAARVEGRFAGAIDVLGAVGAAVVLVVGVFRVASGAVTPGDLVVMVSYARRVHRPLRDLARQAGRIARAFARADRVAEILASDDVLEERPDAYRGPKARGELALESVSFAYTPERPVLRELDLSVAAGQKVALVGPSGVGKSTVAALLARFYDPDEGRVLLDGRDVRDCSLAWLREQVGLVLQETILFTGSVYENIAYGTTAERAAVVAAAKAAGADAFVSELPEGYDTLLGPRGVALSGGQRQRLAIARTLLRDPPVLVLDEPTAALDARSEAEVLAGLEALVEGRTTVIITHSPALARWADCVLELEDGRVVREAPSGAAALSRDAPTPAPAATSPRRTPVPADDRLPQLSFLLSSDDMAEVFERSLGRPAPSLEARVRYLRYKPGTNIVVHYDVELEDGRHDATAMIASGDYLERRAAKPQNVALARLVDGRAPSATPLAFDREARCLVQWYPLDLSLPGLAEPPDALARRLRKVGVPIAAAGEPAGLAYKPRRRAVLGLGRHVLKCYAKEEDFAAATAALRVASALASPTVPRFEGAEPELRVTAQTLLDGHAVGGPEAAASAAGALLRTLHGADLDPAALRTLRVADPSRQLAAAAASAGLVAAIAPRLRGRVERLLRELERTLPDPGDSVLAHGDFNARQLLLVREGLAVTDFDELCLAPAALDPATYIAYVVRGRPGDGATAEGVLATLLEGYGRRPEALGWYLATMVLRRAPRPFRYFDPEWPEGVEAMVEAAEEAQRW